MENCYYLIKQRYLNSRSDSAELFQAILAAAEEIGLDQSLAYLEQCVTEKRLAWLEARIGNKVLTDNPVLNGYRWFYEDYLGISVPKDGEIVKQTEREIVMRWHNPCPTLAACLALGLDTREICKKAYHRPVQEFLLKINPELKFDRNYAAIRPYQPFCEEIISLEEGAR